MMESTQADLFGEAEPQTYPHVPGNYGSPASKAAARKIAPIVGSQRRLVLDRFRQLYPDARSADEIGFLGTLGAGDFEATEQPRTACYWTKSNHVGIRQQQPCGDDDVVVVIDPEKAEGVANAILAIARDIIQARGRK
jgi:hypothetical protein